MYKRQDYASAEDAERERAGAPARPVIRLLLRPRTIAYTLVWTGIGAAMLFALSTRTRLDISAQQDRNPLYVRLADGTIRNSFTVKVRNMEARPRTVEIGMVLSLIHI